MRDMDKLTVEETRDLLMATLFVLKHLDTRESKAEALICSRQLARGIDAGEKNSPGQPAFSCIKDLLRVITGYIAHLSLNHLAAKVKLNTFLICACMIVCVCVCV